MLNSRKGFTLIELMIVIAIIAVIAAIAIPGLLASQRAANERSASTSLKTLASAEADFRANDRDANKVNDFWTLDVKGLYTLTPYSTVATGASTDTIRLIESGVAGADAANTATNGVHCVPLTTLTTKSAKAGFWFQALLADTSGAAELYAQNTGGTDVAGTPVSAPEYHSSKFGFMSMPDSMSSGRFCYILNEGNELKRRALTGSIRAPGATSGDIRSIDVLYAVWPNDTALKNAWSKID